MLLVSGITTILHSYFGTRLPLVQGSSFVYLAPALVIMNSADFRNLTEHVSYLQLLIALLMYNDSSKFLARQCKWWKKTQRPYGKLRCLSLKIICITDWLITK